MKASDYIAAFLSENGVEVVYEMCGGMITHLLDSLQKHPEIRIVSMHHEQAAAFAAEGGARLTGRLGVALATSGPGATNLVTGIGSCYFDSVPVIFITGQVNTYELRGDSGVRQAGFQEADIISITAPVAKGAWQATSASELPRLLAGAFHLAIEGRPGPVLLDIPMDVQRAEIDVAAVTIERPLRRVPETPDGALQLMVEANRPLVLVGGGVRAAGAESTLRDFVELTGIPVVTSLMGLDLLPFDHPLRVGLIGTYGNRWANLTMRDSDCLLILGTRLDVRQTGADIQSFRAEKTLIQIDIDANQLAWRIPAELQLHCDVGAFLKLALGRARALSWPLRQTWWAAIEDHKKAWPDVDEFGDTPGINPALAMRCLSELASAASAFVLDVGQNQMWAAQSLRLSRGQRLLTTGGMGAMGFALPAAIGAAISAPGKPVVTVVGDGGIQVNIQELETVTRLALPVKILVMNNGCLGMVRQFQDEYFDSRYQSTLWGYGAPDFVAVAEAYGMNAERVDQPSCLVDALTRLMADPTMPGLLDLSLDFATRVTPKVPFGNSVYVMEPPPGAKKSDA